ncbi:GGDEF domain-containing protein [Endozoicomonas sp. SM1973]|uniref:diguanylate cyclase n=1 Tax=Spartinivicinus marinus TaxID=2994442 RepID=A0A853I8H0_9GAMM|nr:GGDEF domain-containing protein [Spartinivicinus marinus]MCX4029671.1 GGDEF domain-containing protein [Spartinivicinus marinus]NYZ66948.1 GGDEF domain-containing protein [Spartinivicinus marinus]
MAPPAGWLLIRWLQGQNVWFEVYQNIGLYLYMLIGSMVVFGCIGWYVGYNETVVGQLSVKDPTTGLFNIRHFRSRLVEEVSTAKRHKISFALIMLDIDSFKLINQQYGHTIGDEFLVAIAETITKTLRSNEVIARIGGEEFAIILPYCSVEGAKEIAERLRQAVSLIKLPIDEHTFISRTISLGIAVYNKLETSDLLYLRAERALLAAKQQGEGKIVLDEQDDMYNA